MQSATVPDPHTFVTAFLRGTAREWPWTTDASAQKAFLYEAAFHRFDPLIAHELKRSGAATGWPGSVLRTINRTLRHHTAREALMQVELTRVLDALGGAGVPTLLIKGTALAYTVYPVPAVRRRNDTDIVIRRADCERAVSVLNDLGYRRENYLIGEHVSHQALFRRTDRYGNVHDLDVHWKISNRPLFADMLSWDELDAAAVPVPALGAHARAAGLLHALTIACVHPVAHHGNAPVNRLRWIYDIHLLATALPESDVEPWVELVKRIQIRAVCAHGLAQAREHFGTEIPRQALEAFSRAAGERSAWYLTAAPWRGDVRLSDLRTTPGLRGKLQLAREVVLPAASYMREEYRVPSSALVIPLYFFRAVRGCWRLFLRACRPGTHAPLSGPAGSSRDL